MKTLTILAMLLIALGCAQQQKKAPTPYSFTDMGEKFTETEQMLQDIKTFHASLADAGETQDSRYDRFFASMDKYSYYQLPTYKLDVQKLYANPGAEQIKSCIVPADFVNVIAIKDGKADVRLKCRKSGDRWTEGGGSFNYGEVIGWMRDSLASANTKEYKILTVGPTEFVTYQKEGKDLYFNIKGEPFSAGELCEFVLQTCYNTAEE